MATSKEQAEQATRDDKGRFRPGVSGNAAGRPKGSANSLLTQARQWVESKGLPMLIQAAEQGDADALRALVVMAIPKAKPLNPPLDCLADLPLPERPKDLGRTAAFLLEAVAAGKLSTADAEAVLALAKKAVDLGQLGKPLNLDDFRL